MHHAWQSVVTFPFVLPVSLQFIIFSFLPVCTHRYQPKEITLFGEYNIQLSTDRVLQSNMSYADGYVEFSVQPFLLRYA